MLSEFFQTLPLPNNQLTGSYNPGLVLLSYIIGSIASYVALDITGRMRDVGISRFASILWLIGGSFAMGVGIWSMHFIGMLAFIMPMPMEYDSMFTGLSMAVAIIASIIAFSLLRSRSLPRSSLIIGGIILGLAIASMHYVGMAAMKGMNIHYLPHIFFLSIFIAIVASEAALYLAIKSTDRRIKHRFLLKICSALIMGAAICGMHYTGMAAAVFTPTADRHDMAAYATPEVMSGMIAIATIFILSVAIIISSFKEALSAKTVAMARQSGMAEVASTVLHNVGNILNSVNVSSSVLKDHLNKIEIKKLQKINELLEENKEDLGAYMVDGKGNNIPGYLNVLSKSWQQEQQVLQDELDRLEQNIQHIKSIINLQQSMSGIMDFSESIDINGLLDEALVLTGINFDRHNIRVKKEYGKLNVATVDKFKLTQILVNLIRNAKESLLESTTSEKNIIIKTAAIEPNQFSIEIIDNGIGVSPAQQPRIFSYGYTTKSNGHGFGLHSSIIMTNEMRGSLSVHSEGTGKGARFTLIFPCKPDSAKKAA